MAVPTVFVILVITGYVSTSSIKSRQAGCPSPRFCDASFRPGDCILLEQTYFEVDGKMCPGCQICIHTAELYLRALQLRQPVPESFLSHQCLPSYHQAEFRCRTEPYRRSIIRESDELYYDADDCLIMICPRHGSLNDCPEGSIPHFRPRFYNDATGNRCYVCDSITC